MKPFVLNFTSHHTQKDVQKITEKTKRKLSLSFYTTFYVIILNTLRLWRHGGGNSSWVFEVRKTEIVYTIP